MRMRTIDQAAAHIREQDPDTAITKTALRRLVVTGAIPSVRVGQKYLLALENLDAYLGGETDAAEPQLLHAGIRAVKV